MESPASFESSSYRGNRIVAYLQTLARVKNGLPHGVPVCVCPSHTITTTKALLELASLIGSHIAILQVHADIIDDWSDETVRQLTLLARRHAFLIWESGRILNATVEVVGKQKFESREMRNEMVDLIRKKYTKGIVKAASWAGIATAWASGVAVGSQEADILIPTLKAAAREAVADSVQTIRTEITAVNTPSESYLNGPEAELKDEDDAAQQHLTLDYAVDDTGLGLALRKSSTISLTQTITQHTEDSTESLLDTVTQLPHDTISQTDLQHLSHSDDLPPPPLLARGLVLCLPSVTDTAFTSEYRESCLAAARANPDFVLGFICSEPWHIVSQHDGIFNDQSPEWDERNDCQPYSSDETPVRLAQFSVISPKINMLVGNDNEDESDEELSPATPVAPCLPSRITSPLASKLHTIIGQAIRLRETTMKHAVNGQVGSNTWNGPRVVHVPVVSLP